VAGSDSQRSLERFEAGSKTVLDKTNAMIGLTANKIKSHCNNFTERESSSTLVRLNGRVWHQGNVPGSFYSQGYLPLVSGTVARNPPGDYFSSLRNKVFQLFCILIINFQL
jgi:hypothetical protein